MSHQRTITIFSIVFIALLPVLGFGKGNPAFNGQWTFIPQKSSEIPLYRYLAVEFQQNGSEVTIIQKWGKRRSFSDTLRLKTGAKENKVPITNRVFPSNVFMGLSMPVGSTRLVTARWSDGGNTLTVKQRFTIRASQGEAPVTSTSVYRLSDDGELLTLTIARSTRKDGPDLKYVLKRAGTKEAYYMKLVDNWEITGKLPEQAFLISLQGIANTEGPKLYFIYPDNWPFTYTRHVFDFYQDRLNYTFTELKSPKQALKTLIKPVKGYVVWDKNVRTSLIVAFTVAGLERAVVVSEELIPMVKEAGLKPVEDFRGKFTGQTDAEIYTWAYNKYWSRCNKKLIIWMGGVYGNLMQPGVADWGIKQKAFFNDLSSKPSDKEEYALANKILSEMEPMTLVMGWHSYKKDLERDHVKLTSSYGFRVEGLNTLPNLSFSSQVPATKGFQYKNHHNIVPGKKYIPENKVYITCVQTDGIGLGAWTKPGRGEIPYAWEVTMAYQWMAPAMLEFFYTQATPNDYFIGCLSGPGYIYPKAVPPKLLPPLLKRANELMGKLDLRIFDIMDYSEGATVEGNTELTKEVVDAYYKYMPNAMGFLNGYAPAYTFAIKDGRPLISYDYYLSPTRPVDEAVADVHELATINSKRPYFLLFHVRESSDIKRVKSILDKLGPEFELVPLDVFMKLAAAKPTFKERFLEK